MQIRWKWMASLLMASAVLVGLKLAVERLQWEHASANVSVAISLKDALKLVNFSGTSDRLAALKSFKTQSGLTSLVVDEDTLESLSQSGQISVLTGGQIMGMQRAGARMGVDPNPGSVYVWCTDSRLAGRIYGFLSLELGTANVRVKIPGSVFEFSGDWDELKLLGLGIDPLSVDLLKSMGWGVLYRFHNGYRVHPFLWSQKLALLPPGQVVLFDGQSVLGAPTHVRQLAERLASRKLAYGDIEFTEQAGSHELAKRYPKGFLRVHSISDAELLKLSPQRALSRYLRAIRERSARVVVVHPVWTEATEKGVLEYNASYFNQLTRQVKQSGFKLLAVPTFFGVSQPSVLEIGFLMLGVWVALVILIQRLILGHMNQSVGLAVAVLGSAYLVWGLAGIAWVASVVFPLLAVSVLDPQWRFRSIGLAFAWLFAGLLILTGVCASSAFWSGALALNGVKLGLGVSLVGSLFVQTIRPIRFSDAGASFRYHLNRPISVKIALFGSLFLVITGVFLWRSGNEAWVSMREFYFREWLESMFWVRPRFKEVIAFSFFFLGLWKPYRSHPWVKLGLQLCGALGMISITNTFCHLHTPLIVSFQRSLFGILIGLALSAIGVFGFRSIKRVWTWIATH
jgi:hypothetical protein